MFLDTIAQWLLTSLAFLLVLLAGFCGYWLGYLRQLAPMMETQPVMVACPERSLKLIHITQDGAYVLKCPACQGLVQIHPEHDPKDERYYTHLKVEKWRSGVDFNTYSEVDEREQDEKQPNTIQ